MGGGGGSLKERKTGAPLGNREHVTRLAVLEVCRRWDGPRSEHTEVVPLELGQRLCERADFPAITRRFVNYTSPFVGDYLRGSVDRPLIRDIYRVLSDQTQFVVTQCRRKRVPRRRCGGTQSEEGNAQREGEKVHSEDHPWPSRTAGCANWRARVAMAR